MQTKYLPFQDVENALNKPGISREYLLYKKQSRQTMAKCMAVWNKQSRSTCMADIIHKCLEVYLKCPNDTRWNSMFDAVKFMLLQIKKNSNKFLRLCDELNVVRFTKSDIEWIEEYVIVMEPLAVCLDILQGEKFMYFGYLLPSISQLISQYDNMKLNKNFMFCRPLVDIICSNIEKRFATQLTDTFLTVAAISHPFFKTDWIVNDVKKDIGITQFKKAVNEFSKISIVEDDCSSEVVSNKNQPEDVLNNFFSPWSNKSNSNNSAENEILNYFSKSPTKNLTSLNDTPLIKKVFLKYNTPLPSSAPIERIFSVGSAVLTKKRGRMTDANFEKIMMIKCNTI